jgi:endoglycosylceramidase
VRRWMSALAVIILLGGIVSACGTTKSSPRLPRLSSPVVYPPTIAGSPPLSGLISSPGGPYLYDSEGRVVFFHGVNAVYKLPPYEAYPDPSKPWNLNVSDASLMARLGFDVVRLGMTWKGLEPGTAPSNDPRICTPGPSHDPGQFSQAHLDNYLQNLKWTVDLLGRFHIYTILDMHQDVYNEAFDGEGAPNWAVCTDGVPNVDPPGRWSLSYGTAAAGRAFHNFWTNDVVGDLQGEFDRVWSAVASYFRDDPWILGYDPFNEPFSTSLTRVGDEHFDNELECFYAGTEYLGSPVLGASPFTCPNQDPAAGVVPSILSSDPNHLIFYEPDIYASHGAPNFVGPMNLPNLVFNVHVYCGYRSPVTGNPTNLEACTSQEVRSLATRREDRPDLGSAIQPSGPAWFVSEFGASSSAAMVGAFVNVANRSLVGWLYWAWKYYGDPTGSADEALVTSAGQLKSTASVLSETYPEAIAGTPTAISFDPSTGAFLLRYVPNHEISAPTVIFVPTLIHYPNGYCPKVSGGFVVSKPGSELLQVANARGATSITVNVRATGC